MQKPQRPANESVRLRDLLEYEILDTEPESSYEDIVRLASQICGTPVALISLVDEDRQWFKARVGIDSSETSRDISFCGHAINNQGIFEIGDASLDPRFADNPLVTGGPAVRFYAGAPLLTPTGTSIGTLCVIAPKPGALTVEQKLALESLSKIVMREFESRKSLKSSKELFIQLQNSSKKVEEQKAQLIQAEKLKSLGEIAGGIAHEINTPLSVIQFNAGFITRRLESSLDPDHQELLDKLAKITKTVTRISEIIKGMLLFSRDGAVDDIDSILASQIINSAVSLLRGNSNQIGVEIIIDGFEDVNLRCSLQKTLQIVTNLLSNARDAVIGLEDKWIKIGTRASKTEDFAEIYVIDSGLGILPEFRQKIMQPFYTTKPVGKGTGLGLSISSNLAKGQRGSLYIDDAQPNTCFVLSLPKNVRGV